MSLKLNFMHSHLDVFRENIGALSDETGERLHHDIPRIEERYSGKWNPIILRCVTPVVLVQ